MSYKFKLSLSNLLIWLVNLLDTLSFHTRSKAVSLRSVDDVKSYENLVADFDKVKEFAHKHASLLAKNDEKLKEATYLYFLIKITSASYEAKTKYLPLQVYNEMRNALDHYFRAITSVEEKKSSHIKKMEGHLQRAFLDITKLTCAATMESIDKTHSRIGDKAIHLVGNGDYIKKMTELRMQAENALIIAKQNEYSLGGDNEQLVRDQYLDAISAHTVAHNFYKENLGNLKWARAKCWLFNPTSFIFAVTVAFFGGYTSRLAWKITEELPFLGEFIDWIKSIYTL